MNRVQKIILAITVPAVVLPLTANIADKVGGGWGDPTYYCGFVWIETWYVWTIAFAGIGVFEFILFSREPLRILASKRLRKVLGIVLLIVIVAVGVVMVSKLVMNAKQQRQNIPDYLRVALEATKPERKNAPDYLRRALDATKQKRNAEIERKMWEKREERIRAERAAYLEKIIIQNLRISGFSYTRVSGDVKNTGDKNLFDVVVTVYGFGDRGRPLFERTTTTSDLRPNYTKEFSITIWDVPASSVRSIKASVVDVDFGLELPGMPPYHRTF